MNKKMSIKKFITIFLLLFSITICLKGQSLNKIIVTPGTKNSDNVKLSDLIGELDYIRIETNGDCLIDHIDKISITEKYIYIKTHNPAYLYVFMRTGEFVTKIATQGMGPGEYNAFRNFCVVNEKDMTFIYGSNPDKFLLFNSSWILEHEYSIPTVRPVHDIEIIEKDKILLMIGNYFGRTSFSYEIYSLKNELLKKRIKPIQYESIGAFRFNKEFSYYTFNNSFFIKENVLNDTLYRVSSNLEFYPHYVFKFGKYEFPIEGKMDANKQIKNFHKYIVIKNIFETSKYVLYSYSFNTKIFFDYYDKSKKQSFSLGENGIINDFDGGIKFDPIYQNNNILISYVTPLDLKSFISSDSFRTNIPKYLNKKLELQKLANSLNENDNPVLMLVKLKE